MGAFTIYAMVVTGLYILYMGVTIAFDLHGKKDKKKEDVEEFNTADAGEEKSTVIDETAEGFVVRNGDDDTQGDLDNSDSSDNAAQSQQMLHTKKSLTAGSIILPPVSRWTSRCRCTEL